MKNKLLNLYKMLGYIISDKEEINVEEHEIFSFDILHKTDLNIFVIENNKVFYKNNIIDNASTYGHVEVLEWFKNSGYKIKYNIRLINWVSIGTHIQVLEWFKNINIKKIIKYTSSFTMFHRIERLHIYCYKKTIKYKTKNKYMKGYNKK